MFALWLYISLDFSNAFVCLSLCVCVAGGRSEVDLPETRSTSEEAPGVGGGPPGPAAVPGPASWAAERLGHRPGWHHQASVQLPDWCVCLKYSEYPKTCAYRMCPGFPLPPLDGSKVEFGDFKTRETNHLLGPYWLCLQIFMELKMCVQKWICLKFKMISRCISKLHQVILN